MNIPNLTSFHPESMAVRRRIWIIAVQAWKPNVDDHNAIHLIHHISPVHHLNLTRKPQVTRVPSKIPTPRIRPAFQPSTRCSPRHGCIRVCKAVEVRVTCCLDDFSLVSLVLYNLAPVFLVVPVLYVYQRTVPVYRSRKLTLYPVALKAQSPWSVTSVSILVRYSPSASNLVPMTYGCTGSITTYCVNAVQRTSS
jgi:hypothetical protein